jgi:hypothetical protein
MRWSEHGKNDKRAQSFRGKKSRESPLILSCCWADNFNMDVKEIVDNEEWAAFNSLKTLSSDGLLRTQ